MKKSKNNTQELQNIAGEIEIKYALKVAADKGAKLALKTVNGNINNK